MTFRKNRSSFLQSEIGCVLMGICSLALFPVVGILIALLPALLLAILVFSLPKLYDEFITIDERGISCHKGGKQCWTYAWDRIAGFKKYAHSSNPAVVILPYGPTGKPEPYGVEGHCFQLSKTAKKALAAYSKNKAEL